MPNGDHNKTRAYGLQMGSNDPQESSSTKSLVVDFHLVIHVYGYINNPHDLKNLKEALENAAQAQVLLSTCDDITVTSEEVEDVSLTRSQ